MIHPVKAEIKWRKIHKITSCAWTRKKKKSREGQNPIFSPKDLYLVGRVERFCGFLLRYYGCRSLRDFSGYRVESAGAWSFFTGVTRCDPAPKKARGIDYIWYTPYRRLDLEIKWYHGHLLIYCFTQHICYRCTCVWIDE